MSSYRIFGKGRIDRNTPVSFTFDHATYTGFQGDTLASALLANGVHLVGRSFKYHRPRGILPAGSEEPNALVGAQLAYNLENFPPEGLLSSKRLLGVFCKHLKLGVTEGW